MTTHISLTRAGAYVAPLFLIATGCRTFAGADLGPALGGEERRGGATEHFNDLTPAEEPTALSPDRAEPAGESPKDAAVALDEETADVDITDDVVVDELGDEGAIADQAQAPRRDGRRSGAAERIGAVGERGETDCGLAVVATTSGAVGDPCLTSREFAESLGLDAAAVERVREAGTIP